MSPHPAVAPRPVRWLIATAAAVALADGSIVTLALPQLLRDLSTSVGGVAAVLWVYCAALAVALPAAVWLRRAVGARAVGVGGLVVLGGASIGCALAHSMTALLVLRGLQGVGAAGALPLAFDVINAPGEAPGRARRAWVATAVLGTAAGPALGGVLTQAFDWRAIFAVQAPVALAAAAAVLGTGEASYLQAPGHPEDEPDADDPIANDPAAPSLRLRTLAFMLSTAALSAVLFLLVLMLITGWGLTPLAAAATLTILPLAALAAVRIAGPPLQRAAAGCVMLGAGVLTLGFIPLPSVWWLLAPELLGGLGMGLALPALAGELLPERTARQSARLLGLRHAGIALTLLALAPLVAGRLDSATHTAKLEGVAALLESSLSPSEKLSIAPSLAKALNGDQPRPAITRALAAARSKVGSGSQGALTELADEGDRLVVQVATQGLRWAFVITGVLGLLAGLILRPPRLGRPAAGLVAATLALPLAYGLAAVALKPVPPRVGRPCHPVAIKSPGGIAGLLQSGAIKTLDTVACARGVSREQQILDIAGAD